jgi:hypothetical protein
LVVREDSLPAPAGWKKPKANLPLRETSLSPAARDWPGMSAFVMVAAELAGVVAEEM